MNLSTARVFVNDLQAAKRFYEQTLGLPLKADGGAYGYCVFAAGNCELVIETVNADADADDVAMIGRFSGGRHRRDACKLAGAWCEFCKLARAPSLGRHHCYAQRSCGQSVANRAVSKRSRLAQPCLNLLCCFAV
jgi:catechol 2,3-dioxygenase-like lactoylglutathione lyase family enzyme